MRKCCFKRNTRMKHIVLDHYQGLLFNRARACFAYGKEFIMPNLIKSNLSGCFKEQANMFNFHDSIKNLNQDMLLVNEHKDNEINVVFIYFKKEHNYHVVILEDKNESIEDRFIPCHYESSSDSTNREDFILGPICMTQGYLGYSTLHEAYEFINECILSN